MRIPSTTINGTFYHGTSIELHETPFNNFILNGDWDGVWFADNENIAQQFGEQFGLEDRSLVIYSVNIKCSRIAVIDLPLFLKLKESYDIEDFRELIPILKEKGFNGWKTIGSIDYLTYDDYCIFNPSLPTIIETKILQTTNH